MLALCLVRSKAAFPPPAIVLVVLHHLVGYRASHDALNAQEGWPATARYPFMLQVLLHHLVGRHWRRKLEAPFPGEVAQILHWFGDQPLEQRPYSVHNLCAAGQRHE